MNDVDIQVFLDRLYASGSSNDAHEQEHARKMLNLEPETARFLI